MTFTIPLAPVLNRIPEKRKKNLEEENLERGKAFATDTKSRFYKLKLSSHNVAGPMTSLDNVTNIEAIASGDIDHIAFYQEVNEEDLKDLCSKIQGHEASEAGKLKNFNVVSNDNVTVVYTKDFTLEAEEKRHLKFSGLDRAGEHFIVTVIPHRLGNTFLELNYKKNSKLESGDPQAKVKVYQSFHKIPIADILAHQLLGCSPRDNIALMTSISVKDQDHKLLDRVKLINIHTPAFNFGWQRIDLFRNPTCLAQSYKFQLLD